MSLWVVGRNYGSNKLLQDDECLQIINEHDFIFHDCLIRHKLKGNNFDFVEGRNAYSLHEVLNGFDLFCNSMDTFSSSTNVAIRELLIL